MPKTQPVPIKDLKLDLTNYRTVKQKSEAKAVHSLVTMDPDWFWALTKSLLKDEYLPTENIIVLKTGEDGETLLVKEGNRRIASLKILLNLVSVDEIAIPSDILSTIQTLSKEWKSRNSSVPCAIYEKKEAGIVDRIVARIHGKGQQEGRLDWNSVGTARHNRQELSRSEPALDLLEAYLINGKNVTPEQQERWAAVFPLTVLHEAMPTLASRLGFSSAKELSTKYPTIPHRAAIENIIHDIGQEVLRFKEIRSTTKEFADDYGIQKPQATNSSGTQNSSGSSSTTGSGTGNTNPNSGTENANQNSGAGNTNPNSGTGNTNSNTGAGGGSSTAGAGTSNKSNPRQSYPNNDPRSVTYILKRFKPKGHNRDKLLAILGECKGLKVDGYPHAFCFLLRSMFELSAKAYCIDHASSGGPSTTKTDGSDRPLVDVLRDITQHLTNGGKDKALVRKLHGGMTELARQDGLLSVTSLNQLVHGLTFSVIPSDICVLFGNVFPLLEAMNQ